MNNLIIFRNELKSKHPARYKLIGIVCDIVLSREIFRKNKDLPIFIKNVFNIEFKEYVFSSRTIVISRLVRLIYNCSDQEYIIFKKNIYEYLDNSLKNSDHKSSLDNWRF